MSLNTSTQDKIDTQSIATEQILRFDENPTTDSETANLITKLRSDLKHERNLRKDAETKLILSKNDLDEYRRKSRDLNLQQSRLQTDLVTMRHEKTNIETRNQELCNDLNKVSEQMGFYKNQSMQYKDTQDREYKNRVKCEEKIIELSKQLDKANERIHDQSHEKRTFLIAEEQYRTVIMERDRSIKRLNNEIDQITSRLADSNKLSDGIRKEKSSINEKTDKLSSQLKKEKSLHEEAIKLYKDLKSQNLDLESKISTFKREKLESENEMRHTQEDVRKKNDLILKIENEKQKLKSEIENLKAKHDGLTLDHEEKQLLGENEMFSVKENLRILQEKHSKLQVEYDSLKSKLSIVKKSLSREVDNKDDRVRKFENQCDDLNSKIRVLTVDYEKANSDKKLVLKKLKRERNSTQDKISLYITQSNEYKKRVTTLEPLIERLSFRVDELATDRNKLLNKIVDLENENLKLSKDLVNVTNLTTKSNTVNLLNSYKQTRAELSNLNEKDEQMVKSLTSTQVQLERINNDLKRSEQENSIYFNTITDLQASKLKLEARIAALQMKDKEHVKTLTQMTTRADEITKDAHNMAQAEQNRSNQLAERYRHVMEKLQDKDLEVERLKSQIALDKTLASLRR